MLNQVQLIGNLGADPEIRTTNSGVRVASLRLATSERWTQDGKKMERTEWHRIVIFNENLVKVAEQYLVKGKTIFIQGKISTRKWQDTDGKDRYSTEIVLGKYQGLLQMLGGGKGEGGRKDFDENEYGTESQRGDGGGFSGQDARGNPREDFSADLDDEIPF